MSLPKPLLRMVSEWWLMRYGMPLEITQVRALAGGCINNIAVVEHAQGAFCVKYNSAQIAEDLFGKELKGLNLLLETATIRVPFAFDAFAYEGGACLLLEFLPAGVRQPHYWQQFGRQMAALHRTTDTTFGLDHDNYMGRLPQSNTWHNSFDSFFWSERLEPQLKLALDSGAMTATQVRQFDALQTRIADICPAEPPALIHGDLWSGNFITGPDGYAALIDPAIAYSHRECDLAMTRLFGGFAPEFYAAYHEAFALEPGFDQRVDFYNLYPLLVHVNLFGGGYVGQTMAALRRYV